MTNHSLHATDNAAPKIAIIGGGLTGLLTATLLERAFNTDRNQKKSGNLNITIFEKSRSVGRLATRYHSDSQTAGSNQQNWQWAFGAQFFTAKTPSFQQFISPWLKTGLLQPWHASVVTITPAAEEAQLPHVQYKDQWGDEQPRYISTPKMTSWGRALADELTRTSIQFQTRVAPLAQYVQNPIDEKTELFDETGDSLGQFDWVICTAPNGQAAELMADSGFARQADILKPNMLACYTLMLGWDNEQPLPETLRSQKILNWDVAYVNDSPLDRLFIEHQKPAYDTLLPSITIHARNDWSEAHVDEDIETVKAELSRAAQQLLKWNTDSAPSQIDCHRWRYAATKVNTQNKGRDEAIGILVDQSHRWIVSGDWCGQGNIESCFQMAQETVEAITKVME
ncbi:FAD-dependent oxidoreductase [Psychrobacter sp. B38]|uniref:NAD(P)/FAD-dependent oxidoreductase n=1 Tax=Psychrobacter sp. B38 TaxID=3143538 RepID=UPI00320F999F